MMKNNIHRAWLQAVFMFALAASAQQSATTPPAAPAPTVRDACALKLPIDKKHCIEQKLDQVPYVAGNEVNLFVGVRFGVNVTITGDEISGVTYQPDLKKADVEFEFRQEGKGHDAMMMLVIHNMLKQRLFLDARMSVPDRKGFFQTSIVPVEAGLSNFESWPHPIVQLVLGNFRITAPSAGK